MQTTYSGAHSIIFDDKHTWEDWGLVPASLPTVALPSADVKVTRVPGASGFIDLTDFPKGYPSYTGRSGKWKFIIAHDVNPMTWSEVYSVVAEYLHGKRRKCILTDDRSYFYTGRFTIDDLESSKMYNSITINYVLNPYKEMIWTTCEDWEWNPFDFVYGVIPQSTFKDILVEAGVLKKMTWTQNEVGSAPVTPTFDVSLTSGDVMYLHVKNSITGVTKIFELVDGTNYNPQIEFCCPSVEDTVEIGLNGEGTVSIDFRPGRL